MTRLLAALPALAILLALPRAAEAAPSTADSLFEQGKEAMGRGDLAVACTRFEESLRLEHAVGTMLNLGACEEKSGRLVAAIDHFTAAGAALAKDDFRVGYVRERLDALSARVAHVTLAGNRPVRASLDGRPVLRPSWGSPIPVDPGPHVVLVTDEASNAVLSRVELRLGEGERRAVDLTPPGPPAPAKPAGGEVSSTRRTLAYVTGGTGLAAIAVGAVTGIMTIDAATTVKEQCPSSVCRDQQGMDAAATGRTTSIVSPVAFGLGAALTGLGAYLFVTSAPGGGRTGVAPSVAPTHAGLSLVTSF